MVPFLVVLWWLLVGHFVADYPFQPEFVAFGKNRHLNTSPVPWWYIMTGHAATHAAVVGLVTDSATLSFLEFVCHWIIDVLKCEKLTNIHVDQALHVVCKVAWAVGVVFFRRWLP